MMIIVSITLTIIDFVNIPNGSKPATKSGSIIGDYANCELRICQIYY